MHGLLRHLVLPLCAVVALSCVKPCSEEFFVKSASAADGVYSFSLDLSDSLSVYDIYFYSAVKCPAMGLRILWTGPDGYYYSESAFMTGESERELYRKDVSMKTPGIWRLDVRVSDRPEGFRGLGMQSIRHGAR